MLIVDLVQWWYMRGWTWAARQLLLVQSQKILAFFSVTDLLKTLFSPFRQDTIQLKNAPISVRLQAFGENLISRFLGFIIRTTLIIIGAVIFVLNLLLFVILILLWPLLPLTPFIAIYLFATGALL